MKKLILLLLLIGSTILIFSCQKTDDDNKFEHGDIYIYNGVIYEFFDWGVANECLDFHQRVFSFDDERENSIHSHYYWDHIDRSQSAITPFPFITEILYENRNYGDKKYYVQMSLAMTPCFVHFAGQVEELSEGFRYFSLRHLLGALHSRRQSGCSLIGGCWSTIYNHEWRGHYDIDEVDQFTGFIVIGVEKNNQEDTLTIPGKIHENRVIAIGDNALLGHDFSQVIISGTNVHQNIFIVFPNAFSDMSKLESIALPEGNRVVILSTGIANNSVINVTGAISAMFDGSFYNLPYLESVELCWSLRFWGGPIDFWGEDFAYNWYWRLLSNFDYVIVQMHLGIGVRRSSFYKTPNLRDIISPQVFQENGLFLIYLCLNRRRPTPLFLMDDFNVDLSSFFFDPGYRPTGNQFTFPLFANTRANSQGLFSFSAFRTGNNPQGLFFTSDERIVVDEQNSISWRAESGTNHSIVVS